MRFSRLLDGQFTLTQTARATRSFAMLPLVFCAVASADEMPVQVLEPVTVTGTRIGEAPYNVPASISNVSADEFYEGSLGINLSEGVQAVPGILARNRQDYAQEEQISIRGFGANSTFGILGVRLYVDDIPASQPDGQGASSNFNFASADRVEILRGPFSALYGNSAGGVVAIYTADGAAQPGISGGAAGGSYGTARADIGAAGVQGIADYNLHFTHFQTDGYREHARARRESLNGKVNFQLGEYGKLSLISNYLSAPFVQDPMGLTAIQYNADPRQVDPAATRYNTRKSTQQAQLGAVYEYQLTDAQTLRVLGYYGQRQIEQFLSIPNTSQNAASSPGGVVNLNNYYGGADARWTYRAQLLDRSFNLIVGVNYDEVHEHRRGYNNFIGSATGTCGTSVTTCGVRGTLRRHEINTVYNLDQYVQADWAFAEQWSLLAGVRHSSVNFNSDDLFPVDASHPDTSGNKTYVANSPVLGLMYKPLSWMHGYASYGAGFQTPTIAQIAYRPDASAGLNFGLQAARSRNAEIGTKLRLTEHTKAEFAAFATNSRNELAVYTNKGGRSTYQNIGRSWRRGVEAGIETEFAKDWKLQLSYTYLSATVRDAYLTCAGSPCATPTVAVAAGNRLPGVPQSNAYAALSWGGRTGWHASVNGQYLSAIATNDSNTSFASGYGLVGVDAGYVWERARWSVRPFVRVDNLLDKRYVSAISVNDGNGRFFYPGADRTALAGVSFDWK